MTNREPNHQNLMLEADKAFKEAHDAIQRGRGFLAEIRKVESLSEREAREGKEQRTYAEGEPARIESLSNEQGEK